MREIARALEGIAHEIIFVDDASRDDTLQVLLRLRDVMPTLRVLHHARNAGRVRRC